MNEKNQEKKQQISFNIQQKEVLILK